MRRAQVVFEYGKNYTVKLQMIDIWENLFHSILLALNKVGFIHHILMKKKLKIKELVLQITILDICRASIYMLVCLTAKLMFSTTKHHHLFIRPTAAF